MLHILDIIRYYICIFKLTNILTIILTIILTMNVVRFQQIFNYVAFQVCWIMLLMYGNIGLIIFSIYFNAHLALVYYIGKQDALRLEIITIILISLTGLTIDNLLLNLGVFVFENTEFLPYWYIALWPLLGSTFHHCFYLFLRLPALILALLGAVSVPVIYLGIARATDLFKIGEPQILCLIILSMVWFFLLPFFIKLTLYLKKRILFNEKQNKYEYKYKYKRE